jgi:hypothetical protein
MLTEKLDTRVVIPDSALLTLDENTCTFMLDLMWRAATQPGYEPYGIKKEHCPKCNGHRKTSCYMKRTHGLEVIERIREIYRGRI